MHRPRVLTWHIHGSYLYYLAHARAEFYVPVLPGRPARFVGLPTGGYPWPANVHEVPAESIPDLKLDCILHQSRANYLADQYAVLSAAQLRLPAIYLEHDPPLEHPTDTHHLVDDPGVLLVHVTHFNNLMWDSGRTPTRVIEHGVEPVPEDSLATGELARGLVVVNNLGRRGRRLGPDVFVRTRQTIPLDLVGMGSEDFDGLGEVPHDRLPEFERQYRFFFNPIRYTSLGLAVCEAMMVGLPIVGLATTELASAVEHGTSGLVSTALDTLIDGMRELLLQPAEARRLGMGARRRALDQYHIDRFARDWTETLELVSAQSARPATTTRAAA